MSIYFYHVESYEAKIRMATLDVPTEIPPIHQILSVCLTLEYHRVSSAFNNGRHLFSTEKVIGSIFLIAFQFIVYLKFKCVILTFKLI